MPYCNRCGKKVEASDAFCRMCGARQPVAAPRVPGSAPGNAAAGLLSPRAASILSYVPWFGWIVAVYVLASAKFRGRRDARFHAYQGLFLFVGWLVVDWAIEPWFKLMPGPDVPVELLFGLLFLGVWIFMLIKTSRGERYSLPIVGELAERSL